MADCKSCGGSNCFAPKPCPRCGSFEFVGNATIPDTEKAVKPTEITFAEEVAAPKEGE